MFDPLFPLLARMAEQLHAYNLPMKYASYDGVLVEWTIDESGLRASFAPIFLRTAIIL